MSGVSSAAFASLEAEPTRRCAVHPDAAADHECSRCGSFACPACWNGDYALCETCHAAGHGAFRVAFEQRVTGLPRTLFDVWTRPGAMFGALPRTGLPRPYAFCTACYVPIALAWAAVGAANSDATPEPRGPGEMVGAIFGVVFAALCFVAGAPISAVLFANLRAGACSVLAHLLGGRGPYREVQRACLYTGGYSLALLPGFALFSSSSAWAGGGLMLGALVGTGFRTRALYAFMRGRRRLSPAAAFIAAVSPSAIFWSVTFTLFVVALARAFTTR